jgi:heterodisulfide reductase subunit C
VSAPEREAKKTTMGYLSREILNFDFIRGESGQELARCYQCGKCFSGCPLATEMDLPPNQVIRLIQLGMAEEVLWSNAIWLCASCETCSVRCPKGIDVQGVMDALRRIAYKRGIKPKERGIRLLEKLFLREIRRRGRIWELELVAMLNIGLLQPFRDITKALRLLLCGKLVLQGEKPVDRKGLRELFDRALKGD